MTATTTDGVEVEVEQMSYDPDDRSVLVRHVGAFYWRETDQPTKEAAAAWVSRLTWGEVRLSCL